MATCLLCHQGALRIMAAITPGQVLRKLLRPLQRAADPPPMAPARCRPGAFAWASASARLVGRAPVPAPAGSWVPHRHGLVLRLRPPLSPAGGWGGLAVRRHP